MRTSLIIGIFGLALAVAGIMEWGSRRAIAPQVGGTPEIRTPVPKEAAVDRPETQVKPSGIQAASSHAADNASDGMKVLLVLGGGAAKFRANGQSLSEQMIGEIDQIFTGSDAADLVCAQFVIEGHTDNLGSADVNRQIGLSRALAVRQYLTEKYEIPRDAMRVVSYGGDQPVGDNATPEGRSQNRRVVIKMVDHSH